MSSMNPRYGNRAKVQLSHAARPCISQCVTDACVTDCRVTDRCVTDRRVTDELPHDFAVVTCLMLTHYFQVSSVK